MFDKIAGRYDLLNRVMSLGMDVSWRKKAVAALALREGDHVLDLATGTADLAIAITHANASLSVTGLDPSVNMLEIGREKAARLGLQDRITFIEGDAQALPFESHTFDGVSMAFGIRNVPNRLAALKEIARVLRPSRHVCILELAEPGSGWLGSVAKWYVHSIIPALGAMLSGADEYRYLQRSIEAFPSAMDFGKLIEQAGLELMKVQTLGFGACNLYVARLSPTSVDEVVA